MKSANQKISNGLIALFGLAMTIPFNMGGCVSDVGSGIGNINIGGTSVNAGSLASGAEKVGQAESLGEKDEDAMGESVALAVTNKYPVNTDPVLNKYVTLVGLTIASVSSNPDGNYLFGIVESPDINAFTGPNGYIMVTTGTLKLCKNESELAGVLAHEISHSVHHDGLNAAKSSLRKSGAAEMGTSIGPTQQLQQVIGVGVDVVLIKGYDRDQEIKADKSAAKLMIAAGYDPNAYKAFLMRVKDVQSSNKGGIFSTHPGLAERISAVSAQIPAGQTGAVLKDRFEKRVATLK